MTGRIFKPTAEMVANARKGLELHDRFGRGGTDVGLRRARQLSEQHPLTEDDIKAMHGYFARHAVDKEAKTHRWGDEKDPSAGYVAWLLWGGDAGAEFAHVKRQALAD